MFEVFQPVTESPVLIALTVAFAITSSITVFDTRLIQAKKAGNLLPDEPQLPAWVGLIGWLHWGIGLALLILSWKYALAVFVLKFILSVLPVLETIGNVLMSPFKPKARPPAA